MISCVRRGIQSHATLQAPLLLAAVQRLFPPVKGRCFSSAPDADHLLVSQKDGLGYITINRPKALNAKNCGELITRAQAGITHFFGTQAELAHRNGRSGASSPSKLCKGQASRSSAG